MENGLHEHWRHTDHGNVMKENCKDFQSERQLLTLEDLSSAFLILAIGLVLAVGLFLLEIIHFKVLKSS